MNLWRLIKLRSLAVMSGVCSESISRTPTFSPLSCKTSRYVNNNASDAQDLQMDEHSFTPSPMDWNGVGRVTNSAQRVKRALQTDWATAAAGRWGAMFARRALLPRGSQLFICCRIDQTKSNLCSHSASILHVRKKTSEKSDKQTKEILQGSATDQSQPWMRKTLWTAENVLAMS